jgi:hypothetical protein
MVKKTVLRWGMKLLFPALRYYALSYLKNRNPEEKQLKLFRDKIKLQSDTNIGMKMGLTRDTDPFDIPLTAYGFYRDQFANPDQADLIYPLDDYVKVTTSGSMGKPKAYLIPKSSIRYTISKVGLSFFLLTTHDGKDIRFEIGDIVYRNSPGGSHLSAFLDDEYKNKGSEIAEQVPDINMSYDDKVQYFIDHYEEIDVAYMTVNALMDEVYPRIGKTFHLKGFITQDISARVLKEEIKQITGNYPKTNYGSTETNLVGLPSIEYPGCFFFDWRMAYYEFLPEAEAKGAEVDYVGPPPETVKMKDVNVGERYQLVVTPFRNDLTRYIMPDIMECVSLGDNVLDVQMPVFAFYGRADRLIVLHNFTRIAEEEILLVLKNAAVPYVDFTARVELHGAKQFMVIYIELTEDIEPAEVVDKMHRALLDFDKDWRDLTDFMKYTPLKVHVLPRGTFAEYMRVKDGMPRVQRISMRDDRLEQIKHLVKD